MAEWLKNKDRMAQDKQDPGEFDRKGKPLHPGVAVLIRDPERNSSRGCRRRPIASQLTVARLPLMRTTPPSPTSSQCKEQKVARIRRDVPFDIACTIGCAVATMIIGIDVNPARESLARRFGATHFVNPQLHSGDIVEQLRALTHGGVDYSFECVGSTTLMAQALECTRAGWGVCTALGVPPDGRCGQL